MSIRLHVVRITVLTAMIFLGAASVYSAPTTVSHQADILGNHFVYGPDGDLYAFAKTRLFRAMDEQGSNWETVIDGVASLAIDPTNGKILYAVTSARPIRVIKSLDKGKTWLAINNGLDNRTIYSIVVNSADPQEVFVGTDVGLYRTTDAGFSWQQTSLTGGIQQFFLNTNIACALSWDGKIHISLDGGKSWRDSTVGLPTELVREAGRTARTVTVKMRSVFMVEQPSPLLLAVAANNQVFRSTDNGMNWQNANKGLDPPLNVYGPPTIFYAGGEDLLLSRNDKIYRSLDRGSSWVLVALRTIKSKVNVIGGVIRHRTKPGLFLQFLYQGDDLLNGDSRIGYVAENGSLINLTYGVTTDSYVRALWHGVLNGRSALFATTMRGTGGGFSIKETFVSLDDGNGWEPFGRFPCDAVGVRPGTQPEEVWLFNGGYDNGAQQCLLRADPDTQNLTRVPGLSFDALNANVMRVAFDPKNKTLLYYLAGVNDIRLYRYQYNPEQKQGAAVMLNVMGRDVLVSEDDSKSIFVGPGSLSLDGGFTWTDKSSAFQKGMGNTSPYWYDYRLFSFRGSELRAAISTATFGQPSGFMILKSTDRGDNWGVVRKFDGQQLQKVFVNPDDSRNVILAIAASNAVKAIETKDGGDNWTDLLTISRGSCDNRTVIESVIQQRSQTGRTILVGGCHGLRKSEDDGKSWQVLGGIK